MWATACLGVSAVFNAIGIALSIAALTTNHWAEYQVDRAQILAMMAENQTLKDILVSVDKSDVYFDRSYGLYRECFLNFHPSNYQLHTTDVHEYCVFISEKARLENIPQSDQLRGFTKFLEATRITYVVAVTLACIALLVAVTYLILKCIFKKLTAMLLTIGIIIIAAGLFGTVSMILWHRAQDIFRYQINVAPFELTWHPVLRANTRFGLGWSYWMSWVAIIVLFLSSMFMIAAFTLKKQENHNSQQRKLEDITLKSYRDQSRLSFASNASTTSSAPIYPYYPNAYPYATVYPRMPTSYVNPYGRYYNHYYMNYY